MKIQCKVVNDNSNLITLSIVDDDNNLISKVDCQQVNLCEKLPCLIYTLEENIKADGKNLQNIKQIDISIDSTKNITTKRILISFFNGFFINNTTTLCFNVFNC
ncbi:MAG: hypothetical protein IJT15_00315 [Rickettsiales bacterium]|nr:hypothetical protein [Rickettsiales bacterium]